MARLIYIVTIIGITLMCVLAEELYSDQYDDVDTMSILENERLRLEYYGCFMETSPCITADEKFFKDLILEVLQSKCKRCTEKQKNFLKMLSDWYAKNNPGQWEALVAKSIEDLKKKNAGQ